MRRKKFTTECLNSMSPVILSENDTFPDFTDGPITIARDLFSSKAFLDLGGSGTIILLLILDKLQNRRLNLTGCYRSELNNKEEFFLTISEIVSRGIARSSAYRGRVRVWEMGFFDVIESGSLHKAGKYRYSDRWRLYSKGPFWPSNQPPPGENLYPEYRFKKKLAPS